ncbi:MAG: acetolactate synthase large subunit, partial [Caulobacteraceae bacterium]
DIAAIAASLSIWVKSADAPGEIADLACEAIAASRGPPGGPASLILPADCAWSEVSPPAGRPANVAVRPKRKVSPEKMRAVAERMARAVKPVLLLGSGACGEGALSAAGRIAASGTRVLTDTFIARLPRGAGRFLPDRMMYFGEMALADLAGVDLMVLVETVAPVAFFAYPGKPSLLVPEGCETLTLAGRDEDGGAALEALADRLAASLPPRLEPSAIPERPTGPLTAAAVGATIARNLPEGAIVSDDSVTSGQPVLNLTKGAPPHDWLGLTGGAIGQGMPLAVGAAVAAPGRKVISLNGDGAGAYTLQALWTLAREGLDTTVVVFANRTYRILSIELGRTGAGDPGPAACGLLNLAPPALDWKRLAEGFGVGAHSCGDAESFEVAFAEAMRRPGPRLIEAVLA